MGEMTKDSFSRLIMELTPKRNVHNFNFFKADSSALITAYSGFNFSRAGAPRLKTACGGLHFSNPTLRVSKIVNNRQVITSPWSDPGGGVIT